MGSGLYDSSKIRVVPVFNQIKKISEGPRSFLQWVANNPATHFDSTFVDASEIDVFFSGEEGGGELAIPPNPALTDFLLTDEGIDLLKKDGIYKKAESGVPLSNSERARYELFDPLTREKQRKRARIGGRLMREFLFEGMDYPDVVFVNDRMVLIVEGKLTEPCLKTDTTWLHERDQMIRHLDSAMACEQFKNKKVFGMHVVGDVERDQSIAQSARRPKYDWSKYNYPDSFDYWAGSLPQYRGEEEKIKERALGYLGHVTWHDIGRFLGGVDVPLFVGSEEKVRLA